MTLPANLAGRPSSSSSTTPERIVGALHEQSSIPTRPSAAKSSSSSSALPYRESSSHKKKGPSSSMTTNAALNARQTIDGGLSPAAPPPLSQQPQPPISSYPPTGPTTTTTNTSTTTSTTSGTTNTNNIMISRHDSYSVHSQLSGSAAGGVGADWQWAVPSSPTRTAVYQNQHHQNNNHHLQYTSSPNHNHEHNKMRMDGGDGPDDQEQALFEQRLCEDIYGVAIRKINQNGKSNLRYVKCSYVDISSTSSNDVNSGGVIDHNVKNHNHNLNNNNNNNSSNSHFSSSRSVSSRHSRSGLSRFLSGSGSSVGGGGGSSNRSLDRHSLDPREYDPELHRTLLLPHQSSSAKGHYNSHHHPSTKVRALTWGKKNLVTIPLDRFVVVRKGKTTDRTKRNSCPPTRILSLITNDPSHPSLDIEAPTRLDRDKFARAFARFLQIPLEGDGTTTTATTSTTNSPVSQHGQTNTAGSVQNVAKTATKVINAIPLPTGSSDMRSVRSDVTHQSSIKDPRRSASGGGGPGHGQHSVANSSSVPDVAMTGTNSFTTNNSGSRRQVPLPVVHTSSSDRNSRFTTSTTSGISGNRPLPPHVSSSNKGQRNSKLKEAKTPPVEDVDDFPLSSSHNRFHSFEDDNDNALNVPDPQISSLPSSSNHDVMEFPPVGGDSSNGGPKNSPFPAAAVVDADEQGPKHNKSTVDEGPSDTGPRTVTADDGVQVHTKDQDDATLVSSITGGGFDQDLVEELHLALEKMRRELDESRAEAARAVKVAEQAIQSAENSNSKDWNSTVTHKAAEAAAAAQKKSAEAMAKARVAEEKLEIERTNAAKWKKQVEAAQEHAGHWQTRAAAAEVQRYAVAEALESERKRNAQLSVAMASSTKEEKQDAFDPFESFNSNLSMPSSLEEMDRLRSKLAMESARRRRLLGELQDLRGAVRVYCRLTSPAKNPTVALASNEVLMLKKEGLAKNSNFGTLDSMVDGATPLTFEFDGIIPSETNQQDTYAEFESVCSSVVEGFKICVMTYGDSDSGKTHTMLGKIVHDTKHGISIEDHGVQLRAMKQLFSILDHRRDKFQDSVTMTLIDVSDEKLVDLIAGTEYGDAHGRVEGARKSSSRRRTESEDGNLSQHANSISSSRTKPEIKTNRDGETVVHGVLSVDVSSFDDVCKVWKQCLTSRSERSSDRNFDPKKSILGSHVMATFRVVSRNPSSGVTTTGKIQFVDFAPADTIETQTKTASLGSPSSNTIHDVAEKWKYVNRSLHTVDEVVKARSQYQHSVPYRNSTITHLIRDSLEADTKVIFIACVDPELNNYRNTACTLQFASEMRKVVVGKATRHTTVPTTI